MSEKMPRAEISWKDRNEQQSFTDLGSVLLAYLNVEQAERNAKRPGLGEIPVYDPEGTLVGHLLAPTEERAHASVRLIRGKRTIPLAQSTARERMYDPKLYRVSAKDAMRIRAASADLLDTRDKERSAAALRSRAGEVAEGARDPLAELRNILGRRVLGTREIIRTFTIKDGKNEAPLLTLTDREAQEVDKLVREKLATEEARALLRRLKGDPVEASRWALVIRAARLDRGADLTMAGLQMVIEKDMHARDQGDLVDEVGELYDEEFYIKETLRSGFANKGTRFDCAFVRLAPVPGSVGIDFRDQDNAILKYLQDKNLGALAGKVFRRTAVEAVYDYALLIRTSADVTKDPVFRSGIREAIDYGDPEWGVVVGPFNPLNHAGVQIERQDIYEFESDVGCVISF